MAMCIRASALCFLSVFLVFAFSSAGHACRIDEKTNDHICSESDRKVVTHNAPTAPVGGGGAPSSSGGSGSGSPVVPGGEPIDIGGASQDSVPAGCTKSEANSTDSFDVYECNKDKDSGKTGVKMAAGECLTPTLSSEPVITTKDNIMTFSYAVSNAYKGAEIGTQTTSRRIFNISLANNNTVMWSDYGKNASGEVTSLDISFRNSDVSQPIPPGTYKWDIQIVNMCRDGDRVYHVYSPVVNFSMMSS